MLRKLQASPAAEWAVRLRQQALEWAARQRQHMVAQETCTVSRTRSMACLGRGNHLLAGRYRDQGSFSRGCRLLGEAERHERLAGEELEQLNAPAV